MGSQQLIIKGKTCPQRRFTINHITGIKTFTKAGDSACILCPNNNSFCSLKIIKCSAVTK